MSINKVGVIIGIVHSIGATIWVFKTVWVHFRFTMINWIFGRDWVWGINVIFELLVSWNMFMVFLRKFFYCWRFLDEPWAPERASFYFSYVGMRWNNVWSFLIYLSEMYVVVKFSAEHFPPCSWWITLYISWDSDSIHIIICVIFIIWWWLVVLASVEIVSFSVDPDCMLVEGDIMSNK